MTQTTKTFLTADQGQALANAILHLANVFTTDDLEGTPSRINATRDLVSDIAFPDHAEKPSPAPVSTCDAPHCGCAEGEDCAANGRVRPFTSARATRTSTAQSGRRPSNTCAPRWPA